ncbi:MAG: hypothetical protein PHQ40_06900 [Anaerolineaceae bacterium]|nr:hypothetical protein [Anaerolineaceae bacterium]
MELVRCIREARWATLPGYALFIGMMAAGYFYNITFIQLGLPDLSRRQAGASDQTTAIAMICLSLCSLVSALITGWVLTKHGWEEKFLARLGVATGVVFSQTVLTLFSPWVHSTGTLAVWIFLTSVTLGIGMPVTFSLMVDLIPRRGRGMAAAIITAIAYFASNAFSSSSWQVEHFRRLSLLVMIPGAMVMLLLWIFRPVFLQTLARQHLQPEFARGRFVSLYTGRKCSDRTGLVMSLAMMFAVFFIDSLGFVRLLEAPVYMISAWKSPQLSIHLFIACTHVVAALIGGILFTYLSERILFLWVFGIFALVHLEYLVHLRVGSSDYAPLAMPMLYAIAVSLYTVVNFAIWADLSTPQTIFKNSATGVALSGWSASFLSTALAMQWDASGMPLEAHLRIIAALALLAFIAILYWQIAGSRVQAGVRPPGADQGVR